MTDDLVTWLRQQLDADERQANNLDELGGWERAGIESTAGGQVLDYLDRFSPARVLAEVDAKRRIVDSFAASTEPLTARTAEKAVVRMVLKLLALPYADRPGYRNEWRP